MEQNYKDLYEQAIARAKQHCSDYIVETIFPDVKEHKDERIRKALINQFNDYKRRGENHGFGYSNDEILDYLKRQGVQKPIVSDDALREGITHFGITQYQIDNWLKKYVDVKNQQKLVDKVEPKFKVGDVITNGKIIGKVDENKNNKYHGWFGYDKDLSVHYADIPDVENWHKWSIQDAKAGDVLATEPIEGYHSPFVAIYKKQNEEDFDSYCFIGFDGKFYKGENGHSTEKVHPATKEQRDTLMKAMTDAGYMFDFEKKELKKVEQTHAWSEEDEKNAYRIEDILKKQGYQTQVDWFKNLRNRVQPQLKQEWSKDDEPLKELAETYLAIFDKHFPILPTLKGEQLADYKNFLNQCQQILGLKYWGIHPTQARLFEKLSLLWAAWGAEHLKGLGQTDSDKDNEKQEWSEEDEKMIESCIFCFKQDLEKAEARFSRSDLLPDIKEDYEKKINWLKSLRPQSHWKPSDEQLRVLDLAIRCGINRGTTEETTLVSLFNDLKKLKG